MFGTIPVSYTHLDVYKRQGISLKAADLKIFGTIEAIKKISLGLEWYPGIDLQASISVNLFNGVIQGGGYIVLIGENYTDWFFEMFAHASVNVPQSIPVFGGMTVAGADLGISCLLYTSRRRMFQRTVR